MLPILKHSEIPIRHDSGCTVDLILLLKSAKLSDDKMRLRQSLRGEITEHYRTSWEVLKERPET